MLKNTPLYEEHFRLGARMAPFAGWNMPIQYAGIIDEHLHTRTKVGLFDICHMGEFTLRGETAVKDIEYLITRKIEDMPAGKCCYGFLLNNRGKILDDLITFRVAQDEFMLVVNAANIEKDEAWIKSHLSNETEFENISEKTAKLDLQGPLSKDILYLHTDIQLDIIKKYRFLRGRVGDVEALISRTGYTGELGYELYFSKEHAHKIWDMLLRNKDVKPIGLGARDTLRLEKGYSLYGHEIDEERTPFEAGLEKFVDIEKNFIGKEALLEQQKQGIRNKLVGFVTESRRIPRHNFNVVYENNKVGKVTSGSFSPCLKKAIGLCYIDKNIAGQGDKITLTDGDVSIEAIITRPPFIR